MAFELLCATLLALLIGLAVTFGGYRFFLVLLPIWGFFFGFFLGAETLQALFGIGFLATITSWVIGFLVGAFFAVFSYLFYMFGVIVIAASLGYGLGVGLMGLIIPELDWIVWLVGIVAAIALVVVTLMFNLQKWVIIIATAVGGAGAIVATLMLGIDRVGLTNLINNPAQRLLEASPIMFIVFLVMAIAGIVVQFRVNRNWEVEVYENRI